MKIPICNVEDFEPMNNYVQCYNCGREMLVGSIYKFKYFNSKKKVLCTGCYEEENNYD